MIELKVAAKETVKISFGGNHGFPLVEYTIDERFHTQRAEFAQLQENNRTLALDYQHIHIEHNKALERIESQGVVIRAADETIVRMKEELNVERQSRIPQGAPLYLIDAALVKKLNEIAIVIPKWQPIETAPKNGGFIFAWQGRRRDIDRMVDFSGSRRMERLGVLIRADPLDAASGVA